MKHLKLPALLIMVFAALTLANANDKPRLIILADMGNEPDEEQQMMHMLMYSNEFDLEGLIAVTGKFLNPNSPKPEKQRLYPEKFDHLIEGYEKVLPNLKKHAEGWPEPDYLRSIVRVGQKGYGSDAIGEGLSSPGSQLIIEALKKDDARNIYLVVNAGSNSLAQALFDLQKEVGKENMRPYVTKLRVYENGAQDDAGAYICHYYPDIFWIRSNYQTYCYGGPAVDGGYDNKGNHKDLGPHVWGDYAYSGLGQHHWLLEHVIAGHGYFGTYYPLRLFPRGGIAFMEGGGTIPWLGLVTPGLWDMNNPHWGGWGGRYTRVKVENEWSKHESVNKDEKRYVPFKMYIDTADVWYNADEDSTYNSIFTPIFRWRKAFLYDFAARMDWCKHPYEKCNHNPIAAVNGDISNSIIQMDAKAGKPLSLDASASTDADGDEIKYNWWIYKEAGTYNGDIQIENSNSAKIELNIPKSAKGKEIHLILDVNDQSNIFEMHDYRRVVLSVK